MLRYAAHAHLCQSEKRCKVTTFYFNVQSFSKKTKFYVSHACIYIVFKYFCINKCNLEERKG